MAAYIRIGFRVFPKNDNILIEIENLLCKYKIYQRQRVRIKIWNVQFFLYNTTKETHQGIILNSNSTKK